MRYSKKLLDKFAEEYGLSLNKTAEKLGVSQAFISKVNKGDKEFSEELALKLADALHLKESDVLLNLRASKATTERERAIWAKLAMSSAATLAIITVSTKAVIIDCVQCILC